LFTRLVVARTLRVVIDLFTRHQAVAIIAASFTPSIAAADEALRVCRRKTALTWRSGAGRGAAGLRLAHGKPSPARTTGHGARAQIHAIGKRSSR
jgi:hypothetical protein